jgi:hypothetical protein
MTAPRAFAITLNACLLVGCAAAAVHWHAASADERAANPTGAGGSVQLEPATERHSPRQSRAIFVCRGGGAVIFSDLPCGQVTEERALRIHEPGPGRVASTASAPSPAATKPRVEPEPKAEKPSAVDKHCLHLHDQLEKLDARMRTGYSAREAAKLWNRWRELNAEIYSARC